MLPDIHLQHPLPVFWLVSEHVGRKICRLTQIPVPVPTVTNGGLASAYLGDFGVLLPTGVNKLEKERVGSPITYCPQFVEDSRQGQRKLCLRTWSEWRGRVCPFFLVLSIYIKVEIRNGNWGTRKVTSPHHSESYILIPSADITQKYMQREGELTSVRISMISPAVFLPIIIYARSHATIVVAGSSTL